MLLIGLALFTARLFLFIKEHNNISIDVATVIANVIATKQEYEELADCH